MLSVNHPQVRSGIAHVHSRGALPSGLAWPVVGLGERVDSGPQEHRTPNPSARPHLHFSRPLFGLHVTRCAGRTSRRISLGSGLRRFAAASQAHRASRVRHASSRLNARRPRSLDFQAFHDGILGRLGIVAPGGIDGSLVMLPFGCVEVGVNGHIRQLDGQDRTVPLDWGDAVSLQGVECRGSDSVRGVPHAREPRDVRRCEDVAVATERSWPFLANWAKRSGRQSSAAPTTS
jgi:hypothetical protein